MMSSPAGANQPVLPGAVRGSGRTPQHYRHHGRGLYPQSGLDADTLLRNADIALYRAKEQGYNTYQFYMEGMQDREVMRLELDKDLSQALANDEFILYYQPQLDLDTNEVTSVEALFAGSTRAGACWHPVSSFPWRRKAAVLPGSAAGWCWPPAASGALEGTPCETSGLPSTCPAGSWTMSPSWPISGTPCWPSR